MIAPDYYIVVLAASSKFFSMPQAAINTGDVDFILPLDDIASTLLKLVKK